MLSKNDSFVFTSWIKVALLVRECSCITSRNHLTSINTYQNKTKFKWQLFPVLPISPVNKQWTLLPSVFIGLNFKHFEKTTFTNAHKFYHQNNCVIYLNEMKITIWIASHLAISGFSSRIWRARRGNKTIIISWGGSDPSSDKLKLVEIALN